MHITQEFINNIKDIQPTLYANYKVMSQNNIIKGKHT